jgi:hypothetical protein
MLSVEDGSSALGLKKSVFSSTQDDALKATRCGKNKG